MALQIDSSRALRTHDQLVALIRAIYSANSGDESRAVEWKSGFPDLLSQSSSFAIARAILGLANRPVDVAQSAFEGVGYVVVGVEPGAMSGQTIPDSAELLNSIRRFTGGGRPDWDPRGIEVDGTEVLVITIEPPRHGDRIALLNRGFQASTAKTPLIPEGTVFVRQPGATERATRQDLEMLQDRLVRGSEVDAAAARKAQQDSELRHLVAGMVDAAHGWVRVMEVLVISSMKEAFQQNDWIEWFTTDSGREMVDNAKLISTNARKIRLLTADPLILEPINVAESLRNEGTDALDSILQSEPNADRAPAYRYLNSVKTAFNAVENAAIEQLTSPR